MESNQQRKRKDYPRKYYPLVIPADPNLPITQSPDPKPLSPWYPGVEFTRMVNGQPVTFVRRQDGSEGPLTEFLVMDDPRKEERPPKRPRFVDDK
jgi:hypothetical protein